MATHKTYLIQAVQTDAAFRLLINHILLGMTAIGAVRTTDTGQIDALTVTYPAVANTLAGYMIFRFNDTLQATRPIFIKISVGRGASAGNLLFNFQIGTGSNGTGTLTGLTSLVTVVSMAHTNFTDSFANFVAGSVGAGGEGWLTMGFNVGSESQNTNTHGFAISRTRNALGVANNEGCNYYYVRSSGMKQRYMDFVNSVHLPTASENLHIVGTVPPLGFTNLAFEGEVPVFPVQPSRPYLDFPDLSGVMYAQNDIPAGQIFATEISGVIHRYWSLGSGWGAIHPSNANLGIALRYE